MSFLLGLVPWYVRIAAIALVLIAAIGFGFVKGLGHKQAEWDEFNRLAAEQRVKEVERLALNARLAQQDISIEREKRANDARKFREKLRNASHLVTCSTPVSVGFTSQFISLYNEGLYQGLPGPTNPPRVDGAGSDAASVGADELLDNHATNAESCNKARSQLTAWQQLARSNGWVK